MRFGYKLNIYIAFHVYIVCVRLCLGEFSDSMIWLEWKVWPQQTQKVRRKNTFCTFDLWYFSTWIVWMLSFRCVTMQTSHKCWPPFLFLLSLQMHLFILICSFLSLTSKVHSFKMLDSTLRVLIKQHGNYLHFFGSTDDCEEHFCFSLSVLVIFIPNTIMLFLVIWNESNVS